MAKLARTVCDSSPWVLYRVRHNMIRARKNNAPIQRIVRTVSSFAKKMWLSGEYSITLITNTLSRSGMTIPQGLSSTADVAPGSPVHFYDAQRSTLANAHFLRFLKSTVLKCQLVVLSVGNCIHCCPALLCQLGHKKELNFPIPPLVCDQCMELGVCEISCESCTAPRFLHM